MDDQSWTLGHICGDLDKPIMAILNDANGVMDERRQVMHPDAPEGSAGWCLQWSKLSLLELPDWAEKLLDET